MEGKRGGVGWESGGEVEERADEHVVSKRDEFVERVVGGNG